MSETPRTIVSDTSCFIVLQNIGELDLLRKVYGEVLTTETVAEEFGEDLPEWVKIESPKDKVKQLLLELQIDKGEASAIALALEKQNAILILDDRKARQVAEKLALEVTGTLGVIIKAKNENIIASIKPLLDKLSATNFRLSKTIEEEALRQANESE